MKLQNLFCATLMGSLTLIAGQVRTTPARTAGAADIPHLRKQGTATQLIVDGQPFLAAAKLNTVLAGVYWAQVEPQEGKFDFSVPDGLVREARSHNLRLVLLWFGSWKNGLSGYPPDWVKRDFQRFPRAQ